MKNATKIGTLVVVLALAGLRFEAAGAATVPPEVQKKLDAIKAAHDAGLLTDAEYAKKRTDLESRLRPAAPKAVDADAIKKKLAALKAAFDAGILSEAEFEAKTEPLEAQLKAAAGPAQPAEPKIDAATRKKLDALKAALDAGILTQEEYDRKRAALLPTAPPPIDPETKKKLAALDAALQAGILSQAEHDAKKAQLLRDRAPGPTPPDRVDAPERAMKVHHDAESGFSFSYPADWSVKLQQGVLFLVPPKQGMTAQGPSELYMIVGEKVAGQGVTRAADPRVAKLLSNFVAALAGQAGLPAMQSVGAATPVPTKTGNGAAMSWETTNPAGKRILARGYISVIQGTAVALVGFGYKEQIAARDADMRLIFAAIVPPAKPAPGP